jgi:hypothetical protein
VNISADEPLSKIRCQIDDEPTFTCTSGLTLSGLTFGEHWVWVWAYDRAGNQSDDVGVHINWAGVPAVKPPAKTDPVPPAKPTVSKPGKPKGGKFKVPYTCADATCKLNVSIKLGKKTQKLKGVTVKKGSGKSSFTFSKATKKWLGKKGKKKATLTVTITGSSGSAKTSLTF